MSVPPSGAILAGKYALRRRLGSGGYGSVYEGENVDLGKKVAIKLIDRRHKTSTEAIARFRREARASAKIESANIVQVFDVGEDATFGLYMVMELLRGEDLRRKIDRAGSLEVTFAVDVAHQIACGLARAHAAGVVHRDLKPANIFLHQPSAEADEIDSDRILVKIVDFGVAKLLDAEALGDPAAAQPLTTAGKTVGTPQYMAPEQVQGLPYDHRGDLWSLGTLLYEMLTGVPAYALRATFQQTALAIVTERPPPIASLAPEVPAALIEVVDRALAHEPAERFADAAAFGEALMNAVPSAFVDERVEARVAELISVRPPRPSSPSRPSAPTSSDSAVMPLLDLPEHRRRAGAWIAIAVLAAAAGILVLAALQNAKRPAPVVASTPPPSIVYVAPIVTVASAVVVEDAEPKASAPSPSVIVQPPPPPKPAPPSSSSAPTPKPAPKEPDQFGGVGVSSSF